MVENLSEPRCHSRIIEVIETTLGCGKGVPGDLFRIVTRYFKMDGKLIATDDPCADIVREEQNDGQ